MADFNEVIGELAGIVGEAYVETEPDALSGYMVDRMSPKAAVFPKDTGQVSEVVQLSNRHNIAIIPRGSGTKMAMGNPPVRVGVVVCTSRMNHLIDVDTSNLTVTVEAGVNFRDIQARLATQEDRCYLPLDDLAAGPDAVICSDRSHSGCFLSMDPSYARTATIGGIVAANSSGSRRLLYRNIRDSILGVRMVAPTGEILGSGGKTVKNVSGYDVSKLAVGSMGSLGIICEMTLKLLPLPEKMETLLISFESFREVSSFVEEIFGTHLLPAAVDVMNREAFDRLNMDGIPEPGPSGYVSAIAIEGFEQAVDRMSTEIMGMAGAKGAGSDVRLKEGGHLLFWLEMSRFDAGLADSGDNLIKARLNYPVSEWRGIGQVVEKTFSDADLDYTQHIHAGNGTCLTRLLIPPNDVKAVDRGVHAINHLLARCSEVGGNLVVEDAPTEVKKRLKIWGEQGSDFVIMKRIKEQLDPSGVMNPGRFVGGL